MTERERPPRLSPKERMAQVDVSRVLPDLKAAFESRDEAAMWEALKQADGYLTGSPVGGFSEETGEGGRAGSKADIKEFFQQVKRVEADPESSAKAIIHLGDGGHSRISLRYDAKDGFGCSLTSNSLAEAKNRWKICHDVT